MLPRIIVFNAVSLDGRTDGFPIDQGQFYGLAASWKEDATLAGAETILKACREAPSEEEIAFKQPDRDRGSDDREPKDSRPLLVVPDSRGRVRSWHFLKAWPYWRGFVSLCSRSTPKEHLDYLKKKHVDCIIAGEDRVDMRAALEELNVQYGVKTVRVDSGGILNCVLLCQGLVDEVSVLIHPSLVGGASQSSIFQASDLTKLDSIIPLELTHLERLQGDVVWLRYDIHK